MGKLYVIVSCFFNNVYKIILYIRYRVDPSGKLSFSFQVGADILNLLLLYKDLVFFHA